VALLDVGPNAKSLQLAEGNIKKSRASVAAVKERPGVFTFLTHPCISLGPPNVGSGTQPVGYKKMKGLCAVKKSIAALDSSAERKFTFTSREIAVLLSTLLDPLPDPFFFAAAAFLHDLGPRHLTCLCGPSCSVFFFAAVILRPC
jgi:hypothetical protein